jgi:uncharacterized protein
MRRVSCLFLSAIVATCATAAQAQPGPSARHQLNCAVESNSTEAAICADPALVERDKAMAQLYAAVQTGSLGRGPSQQPAEQVRWLAYRDSKDCLVLSECYDHRLEDLAAAALLRKPTEALAVLRRSNPKAAPLYEAIYRYVTIDDPEERTAAVKTVIAPMFDLIQASPEGRLAPFSRLLTVRMAAGSDETFSTFLGVATGYVDRLRLVVPCDVLVRRPGLLKALGTLYGSSRDGFLPVSDCDVMLPPLPSTVLLHREAQRASTSCRGGTIRITLWRDQEMKMIAIRLRVPERWRFPASHISRSLPEETQFRNDQQSMIDAATTELSTYYEQVFNVPSIAAKAEARSALDTLIATDFPDCRH